MSKGHMHTNNSWEPVVRGEFESTQMFGRRRRQQIKNQYEAGVGVDALVAIHSVPHSYVRDVVGIRTEKYQWVPSEEILAGPFPSREEAMAEAPLIPDNPRRMSTEQAIQRAIQFFRWLQGGLTLDEVGQRHGISRERVRKVLTKYGFPSTYEPKWVSGTPRETPVIADDVIGKVYRRRRVES